MGYRLLDPTTNRVVVSRNVKFNEKKKPKDTVISDASHNNTEGTVADTPHDDNFEDGAPLSDNNLEDADQHSDDNLEDGSSSEDDNVDVGSPPDTDDSRRPRRDVKLPAKLHDYHLYQAFTVNLVPESFEDFEKLSSKEQVPWGKAMNQEMESLKKNKVWELVDLPNVEMHCHASGCCVSKETTSTKQD
ncbi:hypothetical protein JTE90_011846 [Oedothorax gibbosus]|uniref:Retroviral polymerase SH3-like domain-containing protein n=1 Tax=Oedothorax gibbosus TaxID=931172 RepID=A0AAV6U2Y4_9ARAC|nr:hypothetical protein JTE90_011846 [Oedothorax gibbosus]